MKMILTFTSSLKWLLMMMIAFVFNANAQIDWTPATKQGNIMMTGTSQTNGLDFDVSRSVAGASGIKVFNSNSTGRSLIILGEAWGGKYGVLTYHGQTHVSDPGYTQTYIPGSTVLTGSGTGGLGLVSANNIRFNSGGEGDGKQRMIINSVGNVGIGTASPQFKLELPQNTQLAIGGYGKTVVDNTIDADNNYTRSSFGSSVYWDATNNFWQVTSNGNNDYSAMIHPNGDGLAFITAPGDGNFPKSLTNTQFFAQEKMRITASGKVGIGTRYPDAMLTVKGTIHTNEVKVDLLGAVAPDYVFANNYQLQPLNELKTYIDQNKHLPEVPSAAAMEANGINLGEMNMLLLKKVEELTLYLIEKDREHEALKSDIEKLKNQNYEK